MIEILIITFDITSVEIYLQGGCFSNTVKFHYKQMYLISKLTTVRPLTFALVVVITDHKTETFDNLLLICSLL